MDRFDYEGYISRYTHEPTFNMDDYRFNIMFTKSFRNSNKCTNYIREVLKWKYGNKSYFHLCYDKSTSYQNFIDRMDRSETTVSKFNTFRVNSEYRNHDSYINE